MQSLQEYITEGNITNIERNYREFKGLCTSHNVDVENVEVKETSKHNWQVIVGGKKCFLVSKYILNQAVIDAYDIKVVAD